jgi:2-dehydropantoate 2-reductase
LRARHGHEGGSHGYRRQEDRVRITVFGAGAIGGYIAAKLSLSGNEVAAVARGPHLAAMRARGLALDERGTTRVVPIRATNAAADLGPQDLVVIAIKAHAMASAAPAIAALLGPETVLLPAQNGIPWWFTHGAAGSLEGTAIAAVDPEGAVARQLDPARVVGCVVYMAVAVPEPGLVRRFGGNMLILGEPDGTSTERLARLAVLLGGAGIKIETTPRIRDAVWTKLWGNVAFNPLSVLTGAAMGRMANDPGVRGVLRSAMGEMQQVAERLGARFDRSVDARIDEARYVGDFKTSMLQDFEAGRPIEVDAMVGAVIELGRRVGVGTPMLEAIAALTRLRAMPGP